MKRAALLVGSLLVIGCFSRFSPIPTPPGGTVAVGPDTAFTFYERAEAFYERLIQRRFNALETFHDPHLRQHFRSEERFFDYYAELAQGLADAHFEKSRPTGFEVQEFVFESPSRVLVQIRFRGEDNRPLRPDKTLLIRRDRWELSDDSWWISPGRL